MGNGGRPAPHHPVPGNMWTEGLSTADRLQKKKKELASYFPQSNHASDLHIGTPVATLPNVWHYWISARTGQHGVSVL